LEISHLLPTIGVLESVQCSNGGYALWPRLWGATALGLLRRRWLKQIFEKFQLFTSGIEDVHL